MIEPDTEMDEVWVTSRDKTVPVGRDWTWAGLTRPVPYFKNMAFIARFGERWFLFSDVGDLEPQEYPTREAAIMAWRIMR